MKFYHGTSWESWINIRKSGYLGLDNKPVFLATSFDEAKKYGKVILEVEDFFTKEIEIQHPSKFDSNTYGIGFQICTYRKIPVQKIKEVICV